MIDSPPPPEWQPAGFAGADEFMRLIVALDLDALRAALRVLQLRLGTEDERPGDLDRARILGHEINNRQTGENLRRDLRQLDGLSGVPTS